MSTGTSSHEHGGHRPPRPADVRKPGPGRSRQLVVGWGLGPALSHYLTTNEQYTHISLVPRLPLLIGCDLTSGRVHAQPSEQRKPGPPRRPRVYKRDDVEVA